MLVAPTAAFLEEFQRAHGTAKRSRVIWNGRNGDSFFARRKRNCVLAAGRLWDEAKNIATLCKAAAELGVDVYVAGDVSGPAGQSITAGNATLLGRLPPEQLAQLMAEAAIFVAPARYEPFGLTILEAALSRCALVLGDIPTLRELWDGAAVFVHPDDGAALCHAVRALTEHPITAAELGASAHARARHYSAERMTNAYCETYEALAAPHFEAVA